MMLSMFKRQKHCTYLIRCISSSVVCFKQPKWDKLHFVRRNPPPYHKVPFVDDAPMECLPDQPPIIDKEWGSIDLKIKALRFKQENQLAKMPTHFEKLQELNHLETNLWYHSLNIPLKFPEMLNFVQFLTRTTILPWNGNANPCPLLTDYLNYTLSEELFMANGPLVNLLDQSMESVQLRSKYRRRKISLIMEAVYRGFVQSNPHLDLGPMCTQIDERATVETFVKRLVNEKLFDSSGKTKVQDQNVDRSDDNVDDDNSICEDIYDRVDETVLDKENCTRYRIRSELAWQLRGAYPLKPIYELDHSKCIDHESIECYYRPECFDLHPTECHSFAYLPYMPVAKATEFVRSVAGYWSQSQFSKGDPCEFGLVGVMDAARSEQVKTGLESLNIAESLKDEIFMRHNISEAILTAFAWTSAQAYNQGFTLYNDLTYPLYAQILLMDESHVQLLCFQLNSLTSLWKPEDARMPFNLAWFSPRVKLFHSNEFGEFVNINDQAVSLFSTALSHPINDTVTNAELKPYLQNETSPRDYLITKNSTKHSLIPMSLQKRLDCITNDDSLSHSEKKVFKDKLLASFNVEPLRFYNQPSAHPNDIFFFKLTKKSDLIEELKEALPNFGGQFGNLPEPYLSKVRQYRILKRNKAPRRRVQALPRRWA